MSRIRRLGNRAVTVGSVAAFIATMHSAVNAALLRRPRPTPLPPGEWVSVLLPVRNEAHRVEPCIRALRAALGAHAELVILDDESSDETPKVVHRLIDGDDRVTLVSGRPPPPGWLGKPHACQRLADAANPASTVYVFVDADVVVDPRAIDATTALLRDNNLDLVSPFPRQLADGVLPRLVQPLLHWSWLTFLPVRLAERSRRPSTSAATGQLLAVDAAAYRRAGGHAAVRGDVLEDIALLRAVKRSGGRGVVADGSDLATCRMYDDSRSLVDGYTKSLWAAFGSPAGAATVVAALTVMYVVPALAALRGSRVGALGYAAGVIGRAITAARAGGRIWPDPLAHPASIGVSAWLIARSLRARRNGALTWKDRPLP